MSSPNPRIEFLLVQDGFLEVAKLEQIKIDDALVTALVKTTSWFKYTITQTLYGIQ